MATRTFLELVNDVLTELREPVVATTTSTDYSTLIARFVNSAKRAVENAWQWTALCDTFTVTTSAGNVTYAFTGTDERAQVLDAWNYTSGAELREATRKGMNRLYFGGGGAGVSTGSAAQWIHNGTNVNGETQVDVYPVPVSTETLKFNVYAPPADWTLDSAICEIPYHAIVQTAVALARGERGEDGGINANEQAGFAAKAAADAIALDANQHPDDHNWEAV